MNKTTDSKILDYIKKNKQATTTELVDFLNISRQAVFKQLKKLIKKGELTKIGRPPTVFYLIKKDEPKSDIVSIPNGVAKIINKKYLFITAEGKRKEGVEGFVYWCNKTKQPAQKTAQEYIKTH